ncbi:MAG: DNA helicase UvrD [Epsilonproteobacteria bacterium]|nr:DNA helicase UvrD [Campylobacterota bacterium]|tara:strand:- start:2429 stop:3667 length:1239 start_codon:yes stop_codon:yes gene_type:complete
MRFIADFHIHSKYSHATSKYMDLLALATWGQLKGIMMMGTGDFTHPLWQQELKQHLQEAEPGLFELTPKHHKHVESKVYTSCKAMQRFMLTAEVSTIFKRNGRCYKTHTIILAPSFQAVEKISKELSKIGNIAADGRPILGCDIKEIVKIALDASPDCMVIPAHIWTPWFGMLGSKSGFDSIYDCFEELTEHIYAIETGLSSNFLMNAQISELDKFTLLCNSDAHSVQKLGREANIMDTELSYFGITDALKKNDPKQLVAGIEFFPERGKYYGDGHRACNVYLTPQETLDHKSICPSCHKTVTIGVHNRVNELADRTQQQASMYVRKHYQIVPLLDILSFHIGMSETSKRVQKMYHQMLQEIGSEFTILLTAPLEHIAQVSNKNIAHSIDALRRGDVTITPGYDGVYGQIRF